MLVGRTMYVLQHLVAQGDEEPPFFYMVLPARKAEVCRTRGTHANEQETHLQRQTGKVGTMHVVEHQQVITYLQHSAFESSGLHHFINRNLF